MAQINTIDHIYYIVCILYANKSYLCSAHGGPQDITPIIYIYNNTTVYVTRARIHGSPM